MKRGFTLVEMLCATALAAALMVAVFHVVASLGRTRAMLASAARPWDGAGELVEVIRSDLVSARFFRPTQGRLELVGFGGGDHRPATVTYQVRTAGGRGWLVREEQDQQRGPASRVPRRVELCCGGVVAFGVELLPEARVQGGAEEADEEAPESVSAVKRPAGFRAVPRVVRLVVRAETDGGPEISELIHVH